MTTSLLILGNGQIGSALARQIADAGISAHMLDRSQLDLETLTEEKIATHINTVKPDSIINAAAYTQVDKAEGAGKDAAFKINGEAPGILAAVCKKRGILLVHYSTDYVFDGSKATPWVENDIARPINTYGASKRAGEVAVENIGGDHLIFRTSWVYDARGKNFLNTMLRLGKEHEVLKVVNDQIGAPSFAGDIATATLKAIKTKARGLFHLTNSGETSWHGFAEAIFAEARLHESLRVKQVEAIPSSAYPTPAKRPLNSRLDCSKLKNECGITLPPWQDGLKACMRERYAST